MTNCPPLAPVSSAIPLVQAAFAKPAYPDVIVGAIIGTASDGRELMAIAPSLRPDAILVDIGMPLLNGFDAGSRLKKLLPNTKLIALMTVFIASTLGKYRSVVSKKRIRIMNES